MQGCLHGPLRFCILFLSILREGKRNLAMSTPVDQKGADAAHVEDFSKDKRNFELAAAQQATLSEAKGIIQTMKDDKKVFLVVAAALVSS
jgi:hypothetical protein